jgi:MoaA/NifB/PqqE/SkfB family radical SAM enzyme
MCPQTDNGREKEFKRSMHFDLFKKIIDEALPKGLKYVNIGGSGEPTMSKYLVEAVDYLTINKIESLIYTNGQKLDDKIFQDNKYYYFPALSDLFGGIFYNKYYEAKIFGQDSVRGNKKYGKPNYRILQKSYKKQNAGNFVIMPFYPFDPIEEVC